MRWKKREVLYSKESASVSKNNRERARIREKKLREEALGEVLRILDCSELSDIEKKKTSW